MRNSKRLFHAVVTELLRRTRTGSPVPHRNPSSVGFLISDDDRRWPESTIDLRNRFAHR